MTRAEKARKERDWNPAFGSIVTRYTFGAYRRYEAQRVRTRFGADAFFVTDAERVDDVTGGPAVVRQGATLAEVVAGLMEPCDAGRLEQAFGEPCQPKAPPAALPSTVREISYETCHGEDDGALPVRLSTPVRCF